MPPKKDSKKEEIAKNDDKNELEATAQSLQEVLRFTQRQRDAEDPNKKHNFWDTQPVPKLVEQIKEEEAQGPISNVNTVEAIRKEPFNLSTGFEWSETDVDDENTLKEIYNLLTENYVEDDDNMFRFDYSIEFLRWALKPPGYLKKWHIGVRWSKNKKLMGFISAVPATIKIYQNTIEMVEINFLCVHKALRSKRLAPVLIQEITRRVNLQNIYQAVYTAGRVLPKPMARCRYYHRSLNPRKLIDVGFSHLMPRMTKQRTEKLFALPATPSVQGLRPCEQKDVKSATKLLNTYLEKFNLKAYFSEEEFAHWVLPRPGIMNSYVIENPTTHEITDLLSYYTLPSTIIGNTKYSILKAAYAFYNVATSIPLEKLIQSALILAKQEGFDVYNCLDIMDNESFLEALKFGKGDGNLQYYLYNWRAPEMPYKSVGLVLL